MVQDKLNLTKHDRYLNELCDQIRDSYASIFTQVPISNNKRDLGEIDVLAFRKGGAVDLYEVKCSRRIVKARKQLKRIKRLLHASKVNAYFYCGSSGVLESVML